MKLEPLTILAIVLIVIFTGIAAFLIFTGSTSMEIDLKGGSEITFGSDTEPNIGDLESILSEFGAKIRSGRGLDRWTIYITIGEEQSTEDVLDKLRNSGYDVTDYSTQSISSSIGNAFLSQAQLALLIAFLFMAIVVFILFRDPLPSFYMVIVAVADIIQAFAASQILGIKLSLATFAALLLLIGYSVDTDVLLTTRVLRAKEGSVDERIKNARKTGLTMTGTTIVALIALLLVTSFLTPSATLTQITSVLLIGLVFDVINTWGINASLLKWHLRRSGGKV